LAITALSLGASTRRRTHKAHKHNIGVQWKEFPYSDSKTLRNDITRHKANKHNIGVKWNRCTECDFESKDFGNLKRHFKSQHASK